MALDLVGVVAISILKLLTVVDFMVGVVHTGLVFLREFLSELCVASKPICVVLINFLLSQCLVLSYLS